MLLISKYSSSLITLHFFTCMYYVLFVRFSSRTYLAFVSRNKCNGAVNIAQYRTGASYRENDYLIVPLEEETTYIKHNYPQKNILDGLCKIYI